MTKDTSSDASAQVDENVPAGDGNKETALEVKSEDSAPLHEVLNEALGTTFKSPEDAVKGLKETQNYVGKAGKYSKAVQAVMDTKGLSEDGAVKFIMDTVNNTEVKTEAQAEDTSKFVSREEFDKTMFYKDNPQLAPFSNVINAVAAQTGKTLADAAKDESVKTLIDAKNAQDDSEKSKSALTSNGRLGEVSDKMTQAQESLKAGDWNSAKNSAVAAVLEATESKK